MNEQVGNGYDFGEENPKVVVTLSAYNQSPYNLEAVPRVLAQFNQSLRQSRGKNILFIGSGNFTVPIANGAEEQVKRTGLSRANIASLLFDSNGVVPDEGKVERWVTGLNLSSWNSLYNSGFFPPEKVAEFKLYSGFDSLRGARPYFVVFETNSYAKVVERREGFDREVARRVFIEDASEQNDYDSVIETYHLIAKDAVEYSSYHAENIAAQVSEEVGSLLRGEGGSVFVVTSFTGSHILEEVSQLVGRNASVRYQPRVTVPRNYSHAEIFKHITDGEAAPRLTYARAYVEERVIEGTKKWLQDQGALHLLALNYESILGDVATVLAQSSPERLRSLTLGDETLTTAFLHPYIK